MNRLLLVDDDLELSALLQDYLEQEGFHVTTVYNGESAVYEASKDEYALIVLDVMMPGIGGIEALKQIRQYGQTPVLMLTARGDSIDRILGLELGADDYVAKPCLPRELLARIRAILRRTNTSVSPNTPLNIGPLSVWTEKRQVHWLDQTLELTSTEFNILQVLAQNNGKAVSKADLSELALGRALTRYDRSIDVHISSIRQKLGSFTNGQSCIQTVRGIGYQLVLE